jgi:hypothetical protein
MLLAVVFFASCESYETYGDKKAKERDAIDRFITEHNIKVIDENTFKAQGNTTNVDENEFVKLSRTGVYMQIERDGCGEMLEDNKVVNILCRFLEYNILADSLLICNDKQYYVYNTKMGVIDCSQYVDKMSVKRTGTTITATFIEGMMLLYHSSSASVPSGWLVPLNYIKVGRPENDGDQIAKVRLIVPHSQGTADASSSVYPCYYEITYVREK